MQGRSADGGGQALQGLVARLKSAELVLNLIALLLTMIDASAKRRNHQTGVNLNKNRRPCERWGPAALRR